MPETISIICPTRNRPEGLRRLWQSAKDTFSGSTEIEFCSYLDEDDTVSAPVCQELGIKYRQGPQKIYAQNFNEAYALSTGNIIGEIADDFVFRMKNWDIKVLAEFDKVPDKIIFLHGWDGSEGIENGTHFFVHRKWVEAVGYLFPPYFLWANGDVWRTKVAKMINRQVYLDEMIVEHMHVSKGKAPADSTYIEAAERIKVHSWADTAGYHSLADRLPDMLSDANKLMEVIRKCAV